MSTQKKEAIRYPSTQTYSLFQAYKINEKPRPCNWVSLTICAQDQGNTERSDVWLLDHNFSSERQVWNKNTALPIVVPKNSPLFIAFSAEREREFKLIWGTSSLDQIIGKELV